MARRKTQELIEAELKYCDLVWYERSSHKCGKSHASNIEATIEAAKMRIEAEYPQEVAALAINNNGFADPFEAGKNLATLMTLRWALGEDDGLGDT